MKSNTIKYIQELIENLTHFSSNDVLVNISTRSLKVEEEKKENYTFSENLVLKKLLKKATFFAKEMGIQTLYLSEGIFKMEERNINCPILLYPIAFTKKLDTIELEIDYDNGLINPFIFSFLKKEGIECSNFDQDIQQIVSFLKTLKIDQIDTSSLYIDNFHHHRFQILKDLENIKDLSDFNPNLRQILGEEDDVSTNNFTYTNQLLFPADNDQLDVFNSASLKNTVIQGPPGTGKSQVISNLLAKIIYAGQNALVVSEKRAALDVLKKKLSEQNLEQFLFITTNDTVAKDFINSLEKTWNYLEMKTNTPPSPLLLSEEKKKHLQLQFDLINNETLVGGISFDAFITSSKNIDFQNSQFKSSAPTLKEWKENKDILTLIYKSGLQFILKYLNFYQIQASNFQELDLKVTQIENQWNALTIHFDVSNLDELDTHLKQASICQVIENEKAKPYFNVLNPTSKENKKYHSLKKKYLKIQKEFNSFKNILLNWKTIPSIEEAKNLIGILRKGSFFQKRKAKKRFQYLTQTNFIDAENSLQAIIDYHTLNLLFSNLKIDFYELGISSPEVEIAIIDFTQQQITTYNWDIYVALNNERRSVLISNEKLFNQLKSNLKSVFTLSETTSFKETISQLKQSFTSLIALKNDLLTLNTNCFQFIKEAQSIKEYQRLVYKSNWVKFESLFPDLAKFNYEKLSGRIDEIINSEEEEFQLFSKLIQAKISEKFNDFHFLLRQSNTKLSDNEKAFKRRLKNGKSILVKEFSKTRSHKSIRELLLTDAAPWIKVLKPIWLSNPSKLSACFPLNENEFDFVLFDEASQIPLSHALGAIQRGKRIIVAGDEHQMGPSSLFKAGANETIDLLHQANYYWNKVNLKHHYRSSHPDLIDFSNTYFYDNSLIPFPSFHNQVKPITLNHYENGKYIENKNEEEAKVISQEITKHLQSDKTIGIVAFSKTQLDCIWQKLSTHTQNQLQDKIDENLVFFKSLENIQGDECDVLLISFGYGRNEEGKFNMQFGPLNQEGGAKRLNVLFSRAKAELHFFCSVKAADFKITDNEAIRLLQLFIAKNESISKETLLTFPFGVQPIVKGSDLYFNKVASSIRNVNELVTIHRTLKLRGWELFYS